MQYYKVIKDEKVIDVLNKDEIHYLKYSKKHGRMFNAVGIHEAQAIFSSTREHIWHVNYLHEIPVEGYDTVKLEEIDVYEYNKLKFELATSIEEILDSYTMLLIERGVL